MSQQNTRARLSEEHRRRLDGLVRNRLGRGQRDERKIEPRATKGPSPASFEQELIWIHSRHAPALPLYNEILTVHRTGPLNVAVLERSLSEIVRRHEAWRTTFRELDGRVVQIVQPARAIALPVHDLSRLPQARRECEARRIASEAVRTPMDLLDGPLLRAKLVRMGPEEHRLYVVVHLIMHDGISVYSVFLPELIDLYEAFSTRRPSPLSEPTIQYADYATWQRSGSNEAAQTSLDYWRAQLAGSAGGLELPTDGARPARQSFRGDQHTFTLSRELTDGLKALSHREGATLFATTLTAFKILLHRYTGQEDIGVGTAVSTRREPEVERLLGVFLNRVVLRTTIAESLSFVDLLPRVRRTLVEGLSHGDVPFHVLVKELAVPRDPSRNPLSQITFVFEPPQPTPRAGWDMTQMDVATGASKVDLYMQLDERPEGLVGHIVYSTDLWLPATIVRLAEHFELLLRGIVANPTLAVGAIPMLTAAERALSEPDPDEPVPGNPFERFDVAALESTLPARFAVQVRRHGDRVAVKDAVRAWTYRELASHVDRVARSLLSAQVGPGDRVALLLDHDALMVAGVLGVLRCGAAFVPLDPTHPPERLRRILGDTGATLVVASRKNAALAHVAMSGFGDVLEIDDAMAGTSAPMDSERASPDSIAYLLYTSGSTGEPKGVVQTHRNALHFSAAYTNRLHLSPDDRLAQVASYAVDAGIMDLFGALLNGATLCLVDVREIGLSGVVDHLARERITVYHSTPTVFRALLPAFERWRGTATIRLVVLGGEELRLEDVAAFRRAFEPRCLLVNGFGLTESSVTLQRIFDARTNVGHRSIPLGRPVERTQVTLLSGEGRPHQVYGEIAIRSAYVTPGYWHDLARTAAAFPDDRGEGSERIYRTGDLGRLLPDGTVQYLGRRDLQTKIRGFRVELGEIEAALGRHPGVRECAVTAWPAESGETLLTAHFVAGEQPGPSAGDLRRFLRRSLPGHMIPTAFVERESLPRTPSGKLERRSLAIPNASTVVVLPEEPRDDLERRLSQTWGRLLGLSRISVSADFFALGGHSLLALKLMEALEQEFGVNLPLSTLLEAPTIETLAEVMRASLVRDGAREKADSSSKLPFVPRLSRLATRVVGALSLSRARAHARARQTQR